MVAPGSRPKLGLSVYVGLKYGEPLPWAYWRIKVCEKFGWTLEYYDALSMQDIYTIIAVWTAENKAGVVTE